MPESVTKDAILRDLTAEAEQRFGKARAGEIHEMLEVTAAELAQVRTAAAAPDSEPLVYPVPGE
jgi:hypothetical protein